MGATAPKVGRLQSGRSRTDCSRLLRLGDEPVERAPVEGAPTQDHAGDAARVADVHERLGLSHSTARRHAENLLAKLELHSPTALTLTLLQGP